MVHIKKKSLKKKKTNMKRSKIMIRCGLILKPPAKKMMVGSCLSWI